MRNQGGYSIIFPQVKEKKAQSEHNRTTRRQKLNLRRNSRKLIYAYFLPIIGQPLCCPFFGKLLSM